MKPEYRGSHEIWFISCLKSCCASFRLSSDAGTVWNSRGFWSPSEIWSGCQWPGSLTLHSLGSHGALSGKLGINKIENVSIWLQNWHCRQSSGRIRCLVLQLYLTLCDPMDWGPPVSSVHGVLQARILEWVAISFSRGSSQPRDRTRVSWIGRQILYHWATRVRVVDFSFYKDYSLYIFFVYLLGR